MTIERSHGKARPTLPRVGDLPSAVGEGTRDVDGLADPEPTTPLGLVISAALARETLEAGRAISAPQLAVLAGLDRDGILRLMAAGDMPGAYRAEKEPRRPWRVRAKPARAWLAARGVAGVVP